MKKRLCLVLLCFLCLGFIFFNSSQTGKTSNQRSNSIVNKIVTVIQESNFNNRLSSNYDRQEINLIVRKFAHGFEFSLLSIGSYLALTSFGIKGKKIIVYTLFVVLLCATSDELFQLHIPGRNSSPVDVLIDSIGGVIGVYFINLIEKKLFVIKQL